MRSIMNLDQLGLRMPVTITDIDWQSLSESEGQRLLALGLDEGVSVEKLHQGMFRDPIALKIGRMQVAIRRNHARAIQIAPAA